MPQPYEIRTVSDFLAVPPERRTECLADFTLWLELHDKVNAVNRETMNRLAGAGVDPSTLPHGGAAIVAPHDTFRWIDDGVLGGRLNVTVAPSSNDGCGGSSDT